jgi:predicted regulator of amino acid metabolism with ACT domain
VQHLPKAILNQLQQISGLTQFESKITSENIIELKLTMADEKETLPLVLQQIINHGGQIQHCHAQTVSLEDAFVQLVKKEVVKQDVV